MYFAIISQTARFNESNLPKMKCMDRKIVYEAIFLENLSRHKILPSNFLFLYKYNRNILLKMWNWKYYMKWNDRISTVGHFRYDKEKFKRDRPKVLSNFNGIFETINKSSINFFEFILFYKTYSKSVIWVNSLIWNGKHQIDSTNSMYTLRSK